MEQICLSIVVADFSLSPTACSVNEGEEGQQLRKFTHSM
jgi:hypothetical protein